MALNINGTTGISGVDGSASAPAVTGTDSNTGINFASDTVNINTGGVLRATVDSSGNLGVGTASPSGASGKVLEINGGSGQARIVLKNSTTGSASTDGHQIFSEGTTLGIQNREAGNTTFETNGSERLRIYDTGVVQVISEKLTLGTSVTNGGAGNANFVVEFAGQSANAIKTRDTQAHSESNHYIFISGSTEVGRIFTNSSSTTFSTSSDYRLKENVVSISDGISRLKTLKPYRFNFKVNTDTTVDGFLAHEVSSIVPEAISGTKDEVATEDNEERGVKKGDPIYQGIDQSKLVPLLTAALQEAIAKIEVLETKVAALEAG